jgi:hypothetical protein
VASSRSNRKGPGGPLSGLPVNTRPVGPRPPCNSSRGFEEQDGGCVCMPGATCGVVCRQVSCVSTAAGVVAGLNCRV